MTRLSGSDVDERAIAHWRLHTHRLAGVPYSSAQAVVEGLLAVQAENPSQSAWAVATRTEELVEDDVGRLLDDAVVLRTHVLRPTWHYVVPADIRWLLELTAPRVRRAMATPLRNLGLTHSDLDRGVGVVVDALSDGTHLTRDEVRDHLAAAGLPADGRRVSMVLLHAELAGLVCSGRRTVDGTQTYATLTDRAPTARRLDHDAARAELALRYMAGHGPATERDLAYWASLTLTDVRAGLSDVADRLESFDLDGRTYWYAEGAEPHPSRPLSPRAQLLQTLDELHNGYQDSRYVMDAEGIVPRGRPATTGMALVDGQLVAGMRRTVRPETVTFDLLPHRPLVDREVEFLCEAAARYGTFLNRQSIVTLSEPQRS